MTTTSTAKGPREGHHPRDRPPRHRTRLGPGHLPLGGGTDDRAAALVPPPADPLGDPRRHPPSLPQPRLRHHLLPPTAEPRTLLGPLSLPWEGAWRTYRLSVAGQQWQGCARVG